MGIERILMLLENLGVEIPNPNKVEYYIAPMGETAAIKATALCTELRRDGFEAQTDVCGRGLKAQMKYADKIGALFSMVLGDNELQENKATIKNMQNGKTHEISLQDLGEQFMKIKLDSALSELEDSIL